MVDIHAHILPGVDDGAEDLETALQMAWMAADSGVTDLVATPHCNQRFRYENYVSSELTARFEQLERAVRDAGIALRIHRGMEIYGTLDSAQLLRSGQLTTLCGSRYLLVEFDFSEQQRFMSHVIRALQSEGVTPIVAHPERYRALQSDPRILFEWVMNGVHLQINKGSLSGFFGRKAFQTAVRLLRHDLVSFAASDAHGTERRTPVLSGAESWVRDQFSAHRAERLFQINPGRVLRDEELLQCDPVPFSDHFS